MNDEINSIVEDMKREIKDSNISPLVLQTHQSVQMARLLVLLAEEAEQSAKTTETLTKRIFWLNVFIVILTAALIFTTVLEFPKVSLTGYRHPDRSYQYTEQNQTNKPHEYHK